MREPVHALPFKPGLLWLHDTSHTQSTPTPVDAQARETRAEHLHATLTVTPASSACCAITAQTNAFQIEALFAITSGSSSNAIPLLSTGRVSRRTNISAVKARGCDRRVPAPMPAVLRAGTVPTAYDRVKEHSMRLWQEDQHAHHCRCAQAPSQTTCTLLCSTSAKCHMGRNQTPAPCNPLTGRLSFPHLLLPPPLREQ